ncbi:MAG: DUF5689 domain-containing protein [Bacteroidaceae bacterium]|nr:DUF5689 domain-containing protein [Paraprevotella sp.]MDD7242910.1 DUF5689 domain-containing protein [Paraprevotella sp.]MDY2716459.1 DUF5689 domain-containing protein [Bacteroidaceae bacterium]MDY3289049.1 DUF5689 domain-containing protein [Bacteroidaceae bacterium]
MKTRYMFLAIAITSMGLAACMDKDWEAPQFDEPLYGNNSIMKEEGDKVITIGELKEKYSSLINASSDGVKEITDDWQLQVVVNGNDEGGNLYKQISVQDPTGAIIVGINASNLYPYMPVGQQLLINLKGLHIGGYRKQAQIGALYKNGSIGRMDTDVWEQHVRLLKKGEIEAKVDTVDFDENADKFILSGRIVKLSGVTISGEGTQVLAPEDGSVTLSSNCANRLINGKSSLVLRTSSYSKFANRAIPKGKADVYGVCTRYNNTWQILMRTESDLQEIQ